jgi:hypothetical protein
MAITYLGTISEKLANFPLTKSILKGKDEPTISKAIFQHLKGAGLKVSNEKQVGFLKFYVDIDYNDGGACVEVKLASKLVSDTGNTGEMQRLLGQTYYYTKNYKDVVTVVMVLVVGDKIQEVDPKIKEIKKHVEALGAQFKYLSTAD